MPTLIPSKTLVRTIQYNHSLIESKIAQALEKSSRKRSDVLLLAVTKRQPDEVIHAAHAAGLRTFAENYPEEAVLKLERFKDLPGISWHLIGHIQSRKARLLKQGFNLIHSVDSLKLAGLLNRHREPLMPAQNVLVQVNVSAEESKFGFAAHEPGTIADLLKVLKEISALPYLRLRGLMIMPPLVEDAEENRRYFRRARELRDEIQETLRLPDFDQLSMGTSADYEVAVEEGATIIRLGSALIGVRNYEI